eukprot:3620926-Ditylum_brightwellii.AAC.1
MQAIAFSSDLNKSQATTGKLCCLNNLPKKELAKCLHTGHWKFVPLQVKGGIANKEEAVKWLDDMPEMLCKHFTFKSICLIITDQHPTCNYKDMPAKSTEVITKSFDVILKGNMDTVNDTDKKEATVDEENLKNC